MRLHRFTRHIFGACALAVTVCTLAAFTATAGAVPPENVGHHGKPQPTVATPTVVKETVIRPADGTDAIVFVAIGVGALVAILMAGYLGARLATRDTPAGHARVRAS